MSEEDISRLVGKLVLDKAGAMRRRAAIERELELLDETLHRVFRDAARGTVTTQQALSTLEPVRKFVSVDALRDLLEEKDALSGQISVATQKLRELGVEP